MRLQSFDIWTEDVCLMEQTAVNRKDTTTIDRIYDEVIARGGEGIVLKPGTQMYVFNTRPMSFMKRKPEDLTEVVVVGHYKGPNAAKMPDDYIASLVCKMVDSDRTTKEFKVTYKNCVQIAIGTVIRIKHNDYTSTGLPKFPVFMGVRDKSDLDRHVMAEVSKTVSGCSSSTMKNNKGCVVDVEVVSKTLKKSTGIKAKEKGVDNRVLDGTELAPGKFVLVESERDPSIVYTVQMSRAGDCVYCSCPAWKYQKISPNLRMCKHTISVYGKERLMGLINRNQ